MLAQRSWDRNLLLRRALVASLGLHALVAIFIPTWTRIQSQGLQPVETLSFAKLQRIRIERPKQARSLPQAIPKTVHRAAQVSFTRVRAELTANKPKPTATRTPTPQTGPRGAIAAAPKLVQSSTAPLAQAPNSAPVATVSQRPVEPASPNPEASVAERTVASDRGTSNSGGVLPFGADLKDPVLDPAVRTQLQKRFSVHVTLLITVGDDGKTKRVVFQPPVDPQVERQIEALLADANWDAAVCGGGIACQGQATIKL
ncbi:MAG: hypothetical protein ACXWNK_10610 [Vulcanimicrobiaceae bacterium]